MPLISGKSDIMSFPSYKSVHFIQIKSMFYLYLCFVIGYNCLVKLYKYPRYSSHTHEPNMIMSSYLERTGYMNPDHKNCRGTCIPKPWVNDGEEECADGSDEGTVGMKNNF